MTYPKRQPGRCTAAANNALLIVLAVVALAAVGFWATKLTKADPDIETYKCHLDGTEVEIHRSELMKKSKTGDWLMGSDTVPPRLRCTECAKLAMFEVDAETGELPTDVDYDSIDFDSEESGAGVGGAPTGGIDAEPLQRPR